MKWFLSVLVIMLSAVSPSLAQTFTSPVDYCKAVDTIDKSDPVLRMPLTDDG